MSCDAIKCDATPGNSLSVEKNSRTQSKDAFITFEAVLPVWQSGAGTLYSHLHQLRKTTVDRTAAARAALAYYLCVRAATYEILKDHPVPVDVSNPPGRRQ